MRQVVRLNCCGFKRYIIPCDFVDQRGVLQTDVIAFGEPSVAYRWLLHTPKQARVRRVITLREQIPPNINYRGDGMSARLGAGASAAVMPQACVPHDAEADRSAAQGERP